MLFLFSEKKKTTLKQTHITFEILSIFVDKDGITLGLSGSQYVWGRKSTI